MHQSTYGSFNANTKNIDKSCKCNQCSDRFYTFTKEFIDLNTPVYSIEKKLKTYNLRSSVSIYRSMLHSIFDLFKIFTSYIYLPECVLLQFKHINTQLKILPTLKYPMIYPTDTNAADFLKRFYDASGKPPKYLTYDQLTLFCEYCYDTDMARNDIYDEGLYVHNYDIEYLEQCRLKRLSYTFERKYELDTHFKTLPEDFIDTFETPFVVCHNMYSYPTIILLNYLDYVYCDTCRKDYHYIECAAESFYIQSSIVTILYNTLSKYSLYGLFADVSMTKFRNVVRNKLIEISDEWNLEPFSTEWKGTQYYYKKLGLLPPCLEKADIPLEHYQSRIFSVFSDSIIGHPKASHGLYRETLDEFYDIMANEE
jgi:hypothetical protein